MESKYTAIRDIILRNIPGVGNYPTSINGVRIVRRNNPTEFMRCFYNPSCILVLQGLKHMLYGNENLVYTKGQYVVSCTDIPVSSRVVETSDDKPFVVFILELDSNIISNLILETKLPKSIDTNPKALGIADTDNELLDAFYRLALLIEKPESEQQIMSPIIIKEIYYRLLTGPLGSQLRLINTKGTRSNQIAQAISLIKERYSEKLNMDEVAYMGDDLPDLCILEKAGLSACPYDAVDEVKQTAHFISSKNGGKGAVREFCELILKNRQ